CVVVRCLSCALISLFCSIIFFCDFCFFFFFSSRRRHTRCYRDWSSDVCSSDLLLSSSWAGLLTTARSCAETAKREHMLTEMREGSEERRVGKECRSGWWT